MSEVLIDKKKAFEAGFKKALEDGYTAFSTCDHDRKMVSANPFKLHSILYKEWERGFNRAYFEHKKKAEAEEQDYVSAGGISFKKAFL